MKIFPIWLLAFTIFHTSEENLQDDIMRELNNTSAKSLIRKRRYLVFPTGSSFQLGK